MYIYVYCIQSARVGLKREQLFWQCRLYRRIKLYRRKGGQRSRNRHVRPQCYRIQDEMNVPADV